MVWTRTVSKGKSYVTFCVSCGKDVGAKPDCICNEVRHYDNYERHVKRHSVRVARNTLLTLDLRWKHIPDRENPWTEHIGRNICCRSCGKLISGKPDVLCKEFRHFCLYEHILFRQRGGHR